MGERVVRAERERFVRVRFVQRVDYSLFELETKELETKFIFDFSDGTRPARIDTMANRFRPYYDARGRRLQGDG